MRWVQFVLSVSLLSLSVAAWASVRRDAVIYNGTGAEIEIHYIDGELDQKIAPGKSKRIVYPAASESLPINFGSEAYRFPCRNPPFGFMKAGVFKSTFKLVVAADRRLYLIPFKTSPAEALDAAKRQPQPDGWPIEGVLVVDGNPR